MLKTLRITFSMRMTCKINAVLHTLKHLPVVGKWIPDDIYKVQWLKILATVLAVLWEIGGALIGKLLYLLVMVWLASALYPMEDQAALFVHIFLLLTLAGCILNDYLLNHDETAEYAVLLMGMDARQYTLVNFAYSLLKLAVSYLIFGLLLGLLAGVPVWQCLLLPLYAVSVKVLTGAFELWRFARKGTVAERKGTITIPCLVALLGCAYGLPTLNVCVPMWLSAAVMVLSAPAALLCLRRIIGFGDYRVIHQQLRLQSEQALAELESSSEKESRKAISEEKGITSDRHGFEYLNDLFFKRHRKILWKPCVTVAAVSACVVVAALLGMRTVPELREGINEIIMPVLPCFAFVMYTWNQGQRFTQALFVNCDRSLLTYSFYKNPHHVLKLFAIRLREVIRLNLLPAVVIGTGLPLLLYASGGTESWTDYVVLFVTIIAMSVFFSVHYLTIYYLLQPYTAGTEIKSLPYSIINVLTYAVCYGLLQVDLPAIGFGLMTIVFSVIYFVVACLLVYKLAPKTFRIRT